MKISLKTTTIDSANYVLLAPPARIGGFWNHGRAEDGRTCVMGLRNGDQMPKRFWFTCDEFAALPDATLVSEPEPEPISILRSSPTRCNHGEPIVNGNHSSCESCLEDLERAATANFLEQHPAPPRTNPQTTHFKLPGTQYLPFPPDAMPGLLPPAPQDPMKRLWRIMDAEGKYLPIAPRPAAANPLVDGSPYTPWGRAENHLHRDKYGDVTSVHALGTEDEVLLLIRDPPWSIHIQDGFDPYGR